MLARRRTRGDGGQAGPDPEPKELVLRFITHPDSITITHAVMGECNAFAGAASVDLRGVVLRLHHGKDS